MSSSTTMPPTSTPEPQSEGLVAAAFALHLPLHPDLVLLGQRGRRLVCQAHRATPQTRRLHLNRRAAGRHQPLHSRRQRQAQAVRLDQIRRRHPRRRQPRETSVRCDPLEAWNAVIGALIEVGRLPDSAKAATKKAPSKPKPAAKPAATETTATPAETAVEMLGHIASLVEFPYRIIYWRFR